MLWNLVILFLWDIIRINVNPTIHRMTSFLVYNTIFIERRSFMKKYFIDYYAVIMVVLFGVYNLILDELIIGGLLYRVFMVGLIIGNVIILILFRKDIKYKSLVIIIYLLIWLFSNNILQCFFAFSNIMMLCGIGFMESHLIKIISLLIVINIFLFFLPLSIAFLLVFGTSLDDQKGRNDIYSDMHYYCDNNYEVYAYSAGAMDSFHYSIGKYYNILDIDDIIYISFNERNEKTQAEYENFLENHDCKLVGDNNGFK